MGNRIDLPNITTEVLNNNNFSVQGKEKNNKNTFDTKNYLNTRLGEKEKKKEIIIRLLPMNLETGDPFVLTYYHSIKVPKDVFGTEWKSYLCLKKNKDIDHERFGDKCPFCELNNGAYELAEKETDQEKKKELYKLSLSNKPKEAVICRCIERGHEDEGVKFWKFNLRDDDMDPYHQIKELANKKLQKSKEKGKEEDNILDLYKGRDLILTISEANTVPIIVSCEEESTPLSNDEELMKKWVFDEKKWQDVFTPKDYDYLTLVTLGKYPWWDRDKQKWIDKAEFDAEKKGIKNEEETKNKEKINDADKKLKEDTPSETPVLTSKVETIAKSVVLEEEEDDDENVPF